jgi:hypothetical protein
VIPAAGFARQSKWFYSTLPNSIMKMSALINMGSAPVPQPDPVRDSLHNMGRHAAFLTMAGMNPLHVMEMFGNRVLEMYKRERNRILGNVDFRDQVAKLPEVQEVPIEAIHEASRTIELLTERKINRQEVLIHRDLYLRIMALLTQKGAELGRIAKNYRPQDKLKNSNPDNSAARYYLEHREQILPLLKPWSKDPKTPESDQLGGIFQTEAMTEADYFTLPLEERLAVFPELRALFEKDASQVKAIFQVVSDSGHVPLKAQLDQALLAADPNDSNAVYNAVGKFYLEHRNEVLPGYVRILPELREVPEDVWLKKATGLLARQDQPKMKYLLDHPLLPKIFAILLQGGEDLAPLKAKFAQIISGRHRAKNVNVLAAQFYVEHRSEILPHLKPWSQVDFKDHETVPPWQEAAGSDMITRFTILLECPWFPPDVREAYLKRAAKTDSVFEPGDIDSSQRRQFAAKEIAEFYKFHREEILAAKQQAEKWTADAVRERSSFEALIREVSNYPEVKEIGKEQVKKVQKAAKRKGISIQYSGSDLSSRIGILMDQPWFPKEVRDAYPEVQEEVNARYDIRGPDSKERHEYINMRNAEFYKKHHDEIMAAREKAFNEKSAPVGKPNVDLNEIISEVSNYPELLEISDALVNEKHRVAREGENDEGEDVNNRAQREAKEWIGEKVRYRHFYPGEEVSVRIAILLEEPWVPDAIRKKSFSMAEGLIQKIVAAYPGPTQARETLIRNILEFYQANRSRILGAKLGIIQK